MKLFSILFLITPFLGISQKIKVNEFDKFSKLRRVESEPMPILSTDKAKISMSLSAEGPSLLLTLSGYGWGTNTVDGNNNVIFLFSNDNTISVKSTGLQSYEIGAMHNLYKHQYNIAVPDIDALGQLDLVGIRKYGFKDYSDLKVSKELAAKIKKLSSIFFDELKKARIIQTLQSIELKDISKHIDDSVMFCSRVFSSRFYESSDNKPTLLDVNKDFANPLKIVIWEENRKTFNNDPENLYLNRDVCIKGVVKLNNGVPQIVIRNRNQIVVTSLIDLAEIPKFIGDSVTLQGTIAGAKYFASTQNSPTLLNMGADYPNQILTVLIEKKERVMFEGLPEETYLNKAIQVSGKLILYKEKPQIKIYTKNQIKILGGTASVMDKPFENIAIQAPSEPIAKEVSNPEVASNSLVRFSGQTAPKPEETAIKDLKVEQVSKDIAIQEGNGNSLAEFPGGAEAAINFIKANLKNPSNITPGQHISVFARFSITETGDIENVSVVKSAGQLIDKEVISVIKKMPKWIPTMVNGKPIATVITQQVSFVGGDNYISQ